MCIRPILIDCPIVNGLHSCKKISSNDPFRKKVVGWVGTGAGSVVSDMDLPYLFKAICSYTFINILISRRHSRHERTVMCGLIWALSAR